MKVLLAGLLPYNTEKTETCKTPGMRVEWVLLLELFFLKSDRTCIHWESSNHSGEVLQAPRLHILLWVGKRESSTWSAIAGKDRVLKQGELHQQFPHNSSTEQMADHFLRSVNVPVNFIFTSMVYIYKSVYFIFLLVQVLLAY